MCLRPMTAVLQIC
uniref:Uncharacterized protein n=1 Tax=Arundo donax TaxID=35708 RepID=A0A0A9GYU5_ARUDO